jgi:hypothetical protein
MRRRHAEEVALHPLADPEDQPDASLRVALELGRQASEKLISVLRLKRASQVEHDVQFFIAESEHADFPVARGRDRLEALR